MTTPALAVCVAMLVCSTVSAGPLRFERLSLAQGLSQSTVYCILEDRFGFVWVGGENGLNRYDGYGFTVYTHNPDDPSSVASNQIRALLEDRDGRIWVGTVDAGISIFDYHTDRFTHRSHAVGDNGSLASNDVRDILEDPGGDIWVATAAGVDRLRAGEERFRHYPERSVGDHTDPAPVHDVFALALGGDATLWAGCQSGLYVYSPADQRFAAYMGPGGAITSPVTAIAPDGRDVVWVGTGTQGVWRLGRYTGTLSRVGRAPDALASEYIGSLLLDDRGRLWIGTSDRGLDRLDVATGAIDHFPLPPEGPGAAYAGGVPAMLEGRSQILWIGTGFGGLLKADLKERQFEAVAARSGDTELAREIVFTLLEDRDRHLWIGTQDALLKVDRQHGTFTELHPDPDRADRAVYALYQDEDGDLWVGTWTGGLVRLDSSGRRLAVYRHDANDDASLAHDRVLVIVPAAAGKLWIGTWGGGVDLFDPVAGTFAHHRVADGTGLASDRIHALRVDSADRLWVGTTGGGLSRLDPGALRFVTYTHDPDDPATLSSNDVAWVSEDHAGAIWVATAGGLNRLDIAAGRFECLREKHGLPSDATTAVVCDDEGFVWVAHFRGLSRLDPANGRFDSFDTSDGLACTEFNASACFVSPAGEVFFGGVGGVTAFYPGSVRRNPHPPRAVITRCTVNGKELAIGGAIAVTEAIHLTHDENFLGFEFTGLELTFPERNRYAHKLEGFDRDWVSAGARRWASYTNVPPGDYTLQVRAANNHGVWGEPAHLRVVIAPPFWQTWWFRAAGLVSCGLALLVAFSWRTHALRSRLAEQELLVTERTHQLAAANDELRALARRDTLTGVANRLRFTEFIDAEWRRAARFSRAVALLMIDVDDFKAYNDSCGHQAGDECLRRVAAVLAGLVGRPSDLIARFGGEEFIVALSEADRGDATAIAERMRVAVETLAIPHARCARGVVTVSIGVAVQAVAIGSRWDDLLSRADGALYAAKAAGKNRVVVDGGADEIV